MAKSNSSIQTLTSQLVDRLSELPEAERIEALNKVRAALHTVSPFAREPVDCVLWVPSDRVHGNEWNPNTVAPPEMTLLSRSVELDGYTQPIVTCPLEGEGVEMVVDGFHRHRVGKEVQAIRDRVQGYLPVVRLGQDRHNRKDLMASTIRHNRARGKHGIEKMTSIVGEMVMLGWKDAQISAELGMDLDEVIRLKQVTGLASLFKDREFSVAWEPGFDSDDS